jgi:hypothetical protein
MCLCCADYFNLKFLVPVFDTIQQVPGKEYIDVGEFVEGYDDCFFYVLWDYGPKYIC